MLAAIGLRERASGQHLCEHPAPGASGPSANILHVSEVALAGEAPPTTAFQAMVNKARTPAPDRDSSAADGSRVPWPKPDRPQQFHLDVTVDEARLDEAERQVLALSATKHELQPGGNWRVYVDPVGHPFCLCWD
jgi:hypothetical protein